MNSVQHIATGTAIATDSSSSLCLSSRHIRVEHAWTGSLLSPRLASPGALMGRRPLRAQHHLCVLGVWKTHASAMVKHPSFLSSPGDQHKSKYSMQILQYICQ